MKNFFALVLASDKTYIAAKGTFLAMDITSVNFRVARYTIWSTVRTIQLIWDTRLLQDKLPDAPNQRYPISNLNIAYVWTKKSLFR